MWQEEGWRRMLRLGARGLDFQEFEQRVRARDMSDLLVGGDPNLNWRLEDADLEMKCCGALEARGRRF
ncbi:hypothetical protein FCV25MIE_34228 [Fagus crenata]